MQKPTVTLTDDRLLTIVIRLEPPAAAGPSQAPAEDKILTIAEVAKLTKISKAKIYELIKRNQIPHIKIDRIVRIKQSELIRWLNKQARP